VMGKTQPPVQVLRSLIDDVRYREEIGRRYDDPNEQLARWATIEEIINALGAYCQRNENPTLSAFLHDLMLSTTEDDRDKESKLERDAVALMTFHAAKGLEFSEVYMVGMEEGLLPHQRSIDADGQAIDEERRLCYVGVTRAKRRLTLTLALSRQRWGKARPTIPSRFLYELTGQAESPNYAAAIAGKPHTPRRPASQTPSQGTRTAVPVSKKPRPAKRPNTPPRR
jgi:DNA helicase-2/ATP-dependent DNA helicase PcrA